VAVPGRADCAATTCAERQTLAQITNLSIGRVFLALSRSKQCSPTISSGGSFGSVSDAGRFGWKAATGRGNAAAGCRLRSMQQCHDWTGELRPMLYRVLLASTLLMASGARADPDPVPISPPGAAPTAGTPEAVEDSEDMRALEAGVSAARVKGAIILAESAPKPDTLWVFGMTDTDDVINSQTSAFPAQGRNVNEAALGVANANLRGLGPQRSLVLINGRRMQPGDPRAPFADVNFIPRALIKRFDYLTGGASAVYGSDAIAGITNFIMDTNFDGLRIDAQASSYVHDNEASDQIFDNGFARAPRGLRSSGGARDISVAFGKGFDSNNGHVTVYAAYRKQDAVAQSSRDTSYCPLVAGSSFSGFECSGSLAAANGTLLTNVGTFQIEGNQFAPGATPFNSSAYDFLQRPDERYSFGIFADYEISRAAKPYIEAMFMDDRTYSQSAPSGDLFATNTINCDNPLLSAQQINTICVANNIFVDAEGVTRAIASIGRRTSESGAVQDRLRHKTWRVVSGVRGDLSDAISYDAYYQVGATRLTQSILNDVSPSRLPLALDVVPNPAIGGVSNTAPGTPICRIRLTDPTNVVGQSCVPWNIFQSGAVTPQSLAFLEAPLHLNGIARQELADVNFTIMAGEYGVKSPWSDRGIAINVGAEYRKESIKTHPNAAFELGDAAGLSQPVQPLDGNFDVRELFTEVQIPVITNSLFEELTLSTAYRYSKYQVASRSFDVGAFKVDMVFTPVSGLRFRGSYNRANRAPNLVELFSAQTIGVSEGADPCAGVSPSASSAQCALTGVSAAQYGNIVPSAANRYNVLVGGNAGLRPELADTYTFGIVLPQQWIRGFSFSVDYFDIKVRRAIAMSNFQTVMNRCLATGDFFYCSRIHRTSGSGSLWLSESGFIDISNINGVELRTNGADVNARYDHPIGRSIFSLAYASTFLRKLEVDSGIRPASEAGDGRFNCAGFFGEACGGVFSGTPNPRYRHRLRFALRFPGEIGILGQWRHLSAVKNAGLMDDCDVNTGPTCVSTVAPADRRIGAQDYFDLTIGARVADKLNFRVGANNLFDRRPPIVSSEALNSPFENGNTVPQLYDALGRFAFAGVTIDL